MTEPPLPPDEGDPRQRRIEALLAELMGLPPSARRAHLAAAAEGDAELIAEVQELMDGLGEVLQETLGELAAERIAWRPEGLVGQRLGDFELEAELGRGAAGIVYRARQVSRDRTVAVKVLLPLQRTDALRGAERFRREALAAARLRHPAIVPTYYYGTDHGRDYYAMEWIDGPDLRDHLDRLAALPREQPSPAQPDLRDPRACAQLALDLARGLEYAHSLKIIHRDIKPQNVLIDPEGRPRLVDFGLAKNLELGGLTLSGDLTGTPNYMSPEQAQAELGPVDAQSDVYSLGAVLYECLCGEPPASGKTVPEVLLAIVQQRPRDLRHLVPDVPRDLAIVCMKALRHEKAKRYRSAGELARDLDSFLRGRPIDARPPTLTERAREKSFDRRTLLRALPVAAAAGAALFGGGALLQTWIRRRADRPRLFNGGEQSVRIALQPLDEELRPAGEWTDLGRLEVGGELATEAHPWVRIEARSERGERVELLRSLRRGEQYRLAPRFSPGEVELVPVAAGRMVTQFWRPGTRDPELAEVEVEGFELSATTVTNGQFRAYLEATGRDGLDHWGASWRELWARPSRTDWDLLPVVNVRFPDAVAYAEWHGLRLPTRLEAQWARLREQEWVRSVSDRLAEHCNVGRPAVAGRPAAANPDNVGAYLQFVEPSRAPDRNHGREGRLFHLYGNVAEWTATPYPRQAVNGPLEGLAALGDDVRWLRAHSWSAPADRLDDDRLRQMAFTLGNMASADLGFRCARSMPA
jgi:serine/threonine protein kinase/formylglycine-generating enzyme required for sulfatase activity